MARSARRASEPSVDDLAERLVGIGELVRTVNRIEQRAQRIEAALFEEHGIIGRVAILERWALEVDAERRDNRAERRENRIMAGIATLVGSAVGAITSIISTPRH